MLALSALLKCGWRIPRPLRRPDPRLATIETLALVTAVPVDYVRGPSVSAISADSPSTDPVDLTFTDPSETPMRLALLDDSMP